MPSNAPPTASVLETVLYYTDEARTESFYTEVMGFRLLHREPGRSLFYRAGSSVFLLFRPEETERGGKLPSHGARGPGHTCFLVPRDAYDAWRRHLGEHGIDVVSEVEWERGKTFYFRDPDGNLLEIADRDIWPD
jgi:catechol 2,3-dioxygenase-like lactoylglutathione lyase family enzyme